MNCLAAVAFALMLASPCYAADRPEGALTPDQIRAAIDWGTNEVPRPYEIKPVIGGAKTGMGFVYTPYVLVALAAHAASQAGRPLTLEDIPAYSIRPVYYVVIAAIGQEGTESADSRLIELLPRRSIELLGSKESMRPLWVSKHVASDGLLKHIEAPPGSVIAAFDLSALRFRKFLVSYRWYPGATQHSLEIVWGEIPEEHLPQ
jgi:hypothetical protein